MGCGTDPLTGLDGVAPPPLLYLVLLTSIWVSTRTKLGPNKAVFASFSASDHRLKKKKKNDPFVPGAPERKCEKPMKTVLFCDCILLTCS